MDLAIWAIWMIWATNKIGLLGGWVVEPLPKIWPPAATWQCTLSTKKDGLFATKNLRAFEPVALFKRPTEWLRCFELPPFASAEKTLPAPFFTDLSDSASRGFGVHSCKFMANHIFFGFTDFLGTKNMTSSDSKKEGTTSWKLPHAAMDDKDMAAPSPSTAATEVFCSRWLRFFLKDISGQILKKNIWKLWNHCELPYQEKTGAFNLSPAETSQAEWQTAAVDLADASSGDEVEARRNLFVEGAIERPWSMVYKAMGYFEQILVWRGEALSYDQNMSISLISSI